ncbi:retrovirus-related pol polyprotein from transposon TNT 1-94 [Tanacetum coccineum]
MHNNIRMVSKVQGSTTRCWQQDNDAQMAITGSYDTLIQDQMVMPYGSAFSQVLILQQCLIMNLKKEAIHLDITELEMKSTQLLMACQTNSRNVGSHSRALQQAEQSDWLATRMRKLKKQELEHIHYMAKLQEFLMQTQQHRPEPLEHEQLRYLIMNVYCQIQKQLKKANATLTQELTECKSILAETSRTLGESNSIWDSCLVALQNKQTEFEKYKAFNDRTVDYDKLERKLNETLGLLAQKDIDIQEGLKVKAYEISVVQAKHDELVKQSLLTRSHYEGLVKEKTKVFLFQDTTSSTPIGLMAKASPLNLYVKDHLCSSCEVSKAKRSSFKSKTVPSSKGRLNLLHMDLCGPMRVASINGKKYILDETPEVLKEFLTMIQRNLQAPVISVRTDRGTEFLNKTLNAFFKEEGIEHQTSTPRTPEQNGVVERRNRTLVSVSGQARNDAFLLNFLYSFGLKQSQPHAILKTDQSSSQLMRKRHITSLMTENLQLNTFTSLTSVANDTSGLVPQRQKTSDYDNPDPAPELQNVYPSADTTVPSQQELDLLFGPFVR